MRALFWSMWAIVFLLACGGTAPIQAPAWGRAALATNDADFVGAINLEAMRADPLFGRLIERFARRDDFGVLLRASQFDIVATADGRGEASTWVAVAHGVDGPPRPNDLGSGSKQPVVLPGGWLIGEGPAFERARALTPFPMSRVEMPSRALIVSTMRGTALRTKRNPLVEQTTEGLREATVELLGGSHLEIIARFHYVDDASAKRAAALARVILVAMAKSDLAAKIAAALVKIDFDISGDTVTVHYTIDDDLREALRVLVEASAR